MIPRLIAAINDADVDVSVAACEALVRIGKPAMPAILPWFQTGDSTERKLAIEILSRMGTPELDSDPATQNRMRSARVALRSALRDRDERVRAGALEAFKQIGQCVVPELIAAMDDPSAAIRLEAALVLGALAEVPRDGPYASSIALGPLRAHGNDPDPDLRNAVDSAIRAIQQSDRFGVQTVLQDH